MREACLLPDHISAAIWDIDDTLVDTAGARQEGQRLLLSQLSIDPVVQGRWMDAWNRLFWHFPPMDYHNIIPAIAMEVGHPLPLPPDLLISAIESMRAHFLDSLRPVAGAADVLQFCRDHGISLGIVSNGDAEFQRAKLERCGLAKYFSEDSIVIFDERTGKPRPAPLIICCELLGVEPIQAVYVGDRTSDAVAAHLAGCAFVRLLVKTPEAREPSPAGALTIEQADAEIVALQDLPQLLMASIGALVTQHSGQARD